MPDELTETEYVVLIAETIRRSIGVTVDDMVLASAIMMLHELKGRRKRRSRRAIRRLGTVLYTESQRQLAAAFPTFWCALRGRTVHVVTSEHEARQVYSTYRKVAAQLPLRNAVGLVTDRSSGYRGITVGPVDRFLGKPMHRDVAVLVRQPDLRSTLAPLYQQVTAVPGG